MPSPELFAREVTAYLMSIRLAFSKFQGPRLHIGSVKQCEEYFVTFLLLKVQNGRLDKG